MSKLDIEPYQLPVVGAADENYAKHLLVTFLSALDNTKNKENLRFFCIDGGIRKETQGLMLGVMRAKGAEISFLKVNESEYSCYEVIKHLSKVAYYRISIPDIFHGVVDEVLYVDCDTLVLGDVYELKGLSVPGKALGAVEDISRSSHKASGLGRGDYFNSGVLLINVNFWIFSGFKEKVVSALKEKKINNDQCALNVAAAGDWVRLPLRWNYQVGLYRNQKDIVGRYGKVEYIKAFYSPSLIHFVGSDKPWVKACHHPWRESYLPYAKMIEPDFEYWRKGRLLISALGSFKTLKKYFLGVFRRFVVVARAEKYGGEL